MRADNAIVVLIVDKLVGTEHPLFPPWALVWHGRIAPIVNYLFANPRGLVGSVQDNGFNSGESFYHTVIERIKSNAVVNIPRSNSGFQDEISLVTGNVSGVGKHSHVLTFMEHPAVGVRC
jgi:hypothetical protein